MANILGMIGYNKSGSAVNKLLSAYGNTIIDIATGLGTGIVLSSSNNVEFAAFLDRIFYQNYADRPKTFDGTSWTTKHVPKTPISKYLKPFKSRLYLGNCKFSDIQKPLNQDNSEITFPSRVFYSDLFTSGDLTWGIEWGRSIGIVEGTNIAKLDNLVAGAPINDIDFKASNIKVGDPLFITKTGISDTLQVLNKAFTISKVESSYRLILTDLVPGGDVEVDNHFWVGGNWFDVGTDDNDQITGFGENSDRLLIFKLMSLWFYTGSQLRQVKDSVGTSSQRSVINNGGYTYYFHGSNPLISGIYRHNGVSSELISRKIDPFIRGMNPTSYDDVVAWQEGNELRFFIGDLSNANYNIAMTNAVATFNTITNAWDVSPIADVITAATVFRTSNREDAYTGTSDNEVLQMADGNSFNTTPITSALETKVYYPSGSEVINRFPRVQVIGRATKGVRVRYKLWDNPKNVDDEWSGLGELNADKTELEVPTRHNLASGIQFRFDEIGMLENDTYIEKLTIFYRPEQTRI